MPNSISSLTLPKGFSTHLPSFLAWQHVKSIDSTNAYLLAKSQPSNQLLSADQQTAGRGRRQQQWIDEGNSALFSLSTQFNKGKDISAWPVQVALTLAESLNQLLSHYDKFDNDSAVKIKWPNDLYTLQNNREGKCAGILVESTIGETGKVVTGVGINLSPINTAVNEDYSASFIDLPIDKKALIAILANRLFSAWELFLQDPCISISRYQALDLLNGRSLMTTDLHTGIEQVGIGAGINEKGHFILQQDQQELVLTAQQRIRINK